MKNENEKDNISKVKKVRAEYIEQVMTRKLTTWIYCRGIVLFNQDNPNLQINRIKHVKLTTHVFVF